MPVASGISASIDHVVDDSDTAIALGSGTVPVLATPRVVGLFERASVEALQGRLAPGETSVGLRVEVTHISPTKVGSRIHVESTLEKTEGRRLIFMVSARDDRGLVAAGKVTRVIVDFDQFMDKAR
jgi:predicted thioesterase